MGLGGIAHDADVAAMEPEQRASSSRRRWRGAALAALLAGTAVPTALSIESGSYAWLGWTSLVPFLLTVRLLSPSAAALAGAFWGACLVAVCGYTVESAFPQGLLSIGLLIGIPALYACAGSAVVRRKGFNPLPLALGWAGLELALQPMVVGSGLLTGFGSSHALLLPVGALAGYVLVALLVTMATVTVLSVLAEARVVGVRSSGFHPFGFGNRTVPVRDHVVSSFGFLEPVRPRPPPLGI